MGAAKSARNSKQAIRRSGEPGGVLMLSDDEVRAVLTPARCLAALEEAYRNFSDSPADVSQAVGFQARDGKFHVKAALYPGTHDYFAAKVNANFPGNPARHGLPTIQGLIVLCSGGDGRPLAVMQSGEITGRRTAAATALAAKYAARSDSEHVAMIGCGAQARFLLEAIMDVRPVTRVTAFDSSPGSAGAFARWASDSFSIRAAPAATVADAVCASDIIVTCTTAHEPILMSGMVPPGCFIAAVGADNPDKQELDPRLFATARIIVDDLDQCASGGDLAHAIRAGAARPDDVAGTLADLVAGACRGRESEDEIVVFDSTGTGLQDVAAAAATFKAIGNV